DLSGNLTFNAGSSFRVRLNGTTADSGYNQLRVSGAVDLTANPILNIALAFAPAIGDTFTVLVSKGGIRGNFSQLPENATLVIDGKSFRINYTATAVVLSKIGSVATTLAS